MNDTIQFVSEGASTMGIAMLGTIATCAFLVIAAVANYLNKPHKYDSKK